MSRWIALHDSILDNWVWNCDEKKNKAQAFIHLCMLASHNDTEVAFNGRPKHIKRGQCILSQRKLAEEWGWSRNTVKKFFDDLKSSEMIEYETENLNGCATLLTICNYNKYQYSGNSSRATDRATKCATDSATDRATECAQSINNNITINKEQKEPDGLTEFERLYGVDAEMPYKEVAAWEQEHGRKWEGYMTYD